MMAAVDGRCTYWYNILYIKLNWIEFLIPPFFRFSSFRSNRKRLSHKKWKNCSLGVDNEHGYFSVKQVREKNWSCGTSWFLGIFMEMRYVMYKWWGFGGNEFKQNGKQWSSIHFQYVLFSPYSQFGQNIFILRFSLLISSISFSHLAVLKLRKLRSMNVKPVQVQVCVLIWIDFSIATQENLQVSNYTFWGLCLCSSSSSFSF